MSRAFAMLSSQTGELQSQPWILIRSIYFCKSSKQACFSGANHTQQHSTIQPLLSGVSTGSPLFFFALTAAPCFYLYLHLYRLSLISVLSLSVNHPQPHRDVGVARRYIVLIRPLIVSSPSNIVSPKTGSLKIYRSFTNPDDDTNEDQTSKPGQHMQIA